MVVLPFVCKNMSKWAYATRPARTVMPCTTHVLLAAKKRHGRPNGKKVEKIDARQTRGPNFASATNSTLSDSPEAYCPLRLTLCVQQMWERGIPEAAQRPATREVEIQRWKTNSDRSLACPSSVSGPVVRFVIPRGMFFPSFDFTNKRGKNCKRKVKREILRLTHIAAPSSPIPENNRA